MTENKLNDLRKQIDEIDESILKLLEKRMKITDSVGEYKRAHNVAILQKGREDEIIRRLSELAVHPVLSQTIASIYKPIMDAAKRSMKIKTNEK